MKDRDLFKPSGRASFYVRSENEDDALIDPKFIDTFDQAVSSFLLASMSLVDGLPISMNTLERAIRRSKRQFFDFINPYVSETRDQTASGGSKVLRAQVPPTKRYEMARLKKRISRSEHAFRAVSESFLVSLVTQFDTFTGSLVRAVLTERPEVLKSSERTLTFADLQTFASVDDARNFLIDKEIDQILRGSHKDQVEWFEKRMKRSKDPLTTKLGPWSYLTEVTERRNIIVHAGGVVSKQYFEECSKAGLEVENIPAVGSRLEVTPDYYSHAFEVVVEVGLRLAFQVWLNISPTKADAALDRFQAHVVEQITEGRNHLANRLMLFGRDLCTSKHGSALEKTMTINLAQTYKWIGDEEAVNRVLAESDFSASDAIYQLARAVLIDDWLSIEKLMNKLALVGGINPSLYREWPLFQEVRKDERFKECYWKLYSEPLSESVSQAEEENSFPKSTDLIH